VFDDLKQAGKISRLMLLWSQD